MTNLVAFKLSFMTKFSMMILIYLIRLTNLILDSQLTFSTFVPSLNCKLFPRNHFCQQSLYFLLMIFLSFQDLQGKDN